MLLLPVFLVNKYFHNCMVLRVCSVWYAY